MTKTTDYTIKELVFSLFRIYICPKKTLENSISKKYLFKHVFLLALLLSIITLSIDYLSNHYNIADYLVHYVVYGFGFIAGFLSAIFFKSYLLFAILKKSGLEIAYKTIAIVVILSMVLIPVLQLLQMLLMPVLSDQVFLLQLLFHFWSFVLLSIGVWLLTKFDVFRVIFINLLVVVCVNYILYAIWSPDTASYPSYLLPLLYN